MKNTAYSCIFFLIVLSAFSMQTIDRQSFYGALSGGSEAKLDKEISRLNAVKKPAVAYLGALQMKKAGFLKGAGSKVKIFKQGALMLEGEIKSNPENTEYRFIRLAVQENAPKILKYNKNLDEDKRIILAGYNMLDPELKAIIRNYAASSKIIKVSDLK